ncbi:polyprotein [Andean potato mottle virus]|uniref:RNA2 polyprotein n=4 Tax=Andean potato mottle virus TaxID=12259 RepID=A0A6C0NTJ8_APMV|nr:polyprotein [Andean potato mottle virus]QHW16321.1 polyprotein [Andean potato mottle virus]
MSQLITSDIVALSAWGVLTALKVYQGSFSFGSLFAEAQTLAFLFFVSCHYFQSVLLPWIIIFKSATKFDLDLVAMEMRAEKYLNSIPSGVLRDRAKAYNVSKLEAIKDQIPSGKALYQNGRSLVKIVKSQFQSIKGVMKGGEVRSYNYLPVGSFTAGDHCELAVPIMPESDLVAIAPETDFSPETVDQDKKARSVHVGAIEVIMECMTSPDCDIYGGAMFVDTYHEKPENAVRALFVTQLKGGVAPRCLFYPDTQVEIERGMNERFRLILSSGNSDFKQGKNLAFVKVNVALCGISMNKSYVPTAFHENFAKKERSSVIEYLGRYSAMISHKNEFKPEMLRKEGLSFRFGGKTQLIERSPLQYEWSESQSKVVSVGMDASLAGEKEQVTKQEEDFGAPSSTHVVFPTRSMVAKPQMEAAHFENLLDDTQGLRKQTLLNSRIAAGRFSISASAVKGTVVFDGTLAELIGTTLRGAPNFRHTYRQNTKMMFLFTVNVPLTTGIGLMVGYNSVSSPKHLVNEYTISSESSIEWNPACAGELKFLVDPNPCGPYWSFDYFRQTGSRITMSVISPWTTTPTADCAIAWQVHITSEPMSNSTFSVMFPPAIMPVKRWMGNLLFKQGAQEQVRKIPLAIGAAVGDEKTAVMTMSNALISMWSYQIGTFHFEFTKLSSPFIKGTLLAFIAMDQDTTYSLEELQNFPNKIIQFDDKEGKARVTFGEEHFAQGWSTQVSGSVVSKHRGCPYLYVVSKDCIASTIPGDFQVGVKLLAIEDYKPCGYNPGVVVASTIVQNVVSLEDASLVVQPQSCRPEVNTWSEFCVIDIPVVDTSKVFFAQYTLDLINPLVATDTSIGVWAAELIPSPMIHLLRTAAWKKGTLHFKIKLLGKSSIKRADWSSTTRIDVRRAPGTEYLNAITLFTAKPHADELEFKIDIAGPNNGFEMWNADFGNQLSWLANITIGSPNQAGIHQWYVKPGDDFEVSGNRVSPPLDQVLSGKSKIPIIKY